jgi:cyanophycinase
METPKGKLIPIGGAEDIKDEKAVLERFVYEMGKEDPRIEIITTATGIPREVGDDYKDAFDSLGCRNYEVMDIQSPEEADDGQMLERLEKADGVFFTGGNQARIIDAFCNTKFLQILKERYDNENFVVAGTSAGCAALSEYMIMGGTTEEALNKGEIRLSIGLGLIPGVVFDTHFTERGRFGRLMNIVATNPNVLCLGFGEDTAAIIANGCISVIGSGTVTIIDGNEIEYSNITKVRKGDPITIDRIIVTVLSQGEQYRFKDKKVLRDEKEAVIVKHKDDKWEVFNEGDTAILFSSPNKEEAVKFADEVAQQHNLKLNVLEG